MGRYDTYFKGPVTSGSGLESVGTPDSGAVVLAQNQNNSSFATATDFFFQIPPNMRLKEIYIDFGGANVTAGTYTIALGTVGTTVGTPLLLANNVALTTGARTVAGFANSAIAAWNLVTNAGGNIFLRVSLAGVTPVGVTAVSVLVSYVILPTTP